ncbi:hypothetical protein MJO28_016470 [Puccinia striiformis f. sp. tritici]|uniref:Uncharacterized protein n=1 Tax=Puccinia striiformis f. sp. tritici TaxID=168172 RepID=A0ACC0DN31_9BASI|nr:hypothetical protein MJO28_016470 [Puccinia striiformis f. sp. tritici]
MIALTKQATLSNCFLEKSCAQLDLDHFAILRVKKRLAQRSVKSNGIGFDIFLIIQFTPTSK